MNALLKKAIDNLHVVSVNLRSINAYIHDHIEDYDFSALEKQGYKAVNKIKLVQAEAPSEHDKSISWFEYHFFYSTGVRLVKIAHEKEENSDDDTAVEITATFTAIYKSDIQLEKECIEAFSENNVGYHVWPYWRELVQSYCARTSIPLIEIPLYICSTEKEEQ
ncbi:MULTISPECIES: hypothetical protein [unclassified Aeromonas]|uniref:hypothetical protein n=1 Tax=unclassified Aeromonas TaxID=257493 RepID=UPI003528ED47